jgi:N-acetylneuraminate lyase
MGSLNGIVPAVVTPFDQNGRFAAPAFERLLERLYGAGVDGIYVCGTTGEGMLQPPDQRKMVADVAVACTPAGRQVIVHVGAGSPAEAFDLAVHAARAGAHAISSLPPIAGTFSFAEIREYYRSLALASDLPLLVYYFPEACNAISSTEQLEELCSLPNVAGVKFTDFDLYKMAEVKREDRVMFNGRDEVLVAGLLMGADGGIGSFYNVVPELFVQLHALARAGRWEAARALQRQANALITLTLRFPLFPALKQILAWSGIACGTCLPPRGPLSDEQRARLRTSLVAAGFDSLVAASAGP